jgi:hypothetical protein
MSVASRTVGLCAIAAGTVASTISGILSSPRIFLATWREGKNWGDDYLAQSLIRYLTARKVPFKVIETGLSLEHHYPTARDVVLVGGGGLWGPSGSGRLDDLLYSAWASTKATLIVANIGIESFHPSSAAQLLHLAARSSLLSFRDELSYTLARGVLPEEVCMWAADNTYLAPLKIDRLSEPGCIAVNLCGPEQENHVRPYSVPRIIKSILQLKGLGYEIRAAVFTYGGPLTDYQHCVQVDASCSKGFSVIPFRDCEVFIGMHFHSCLLAMQNEIPVVGISYSDKVRRLFTEYGLPMYCIDPEDPDLPTKIPSLVASARDQREKLIGQMRDGNSRALDRLAPFCAKLCNLLHVR